MRRTRGWMCRRSWWLLLLAAAWLAPTSGYANDTPSETSRAGEHAPAPAVVNLNQATEEELELLPRIGPTRAHAIVEHRRRHPFRKIEDLIRVKGIGRKTFGKLRPYLRVSGPTTLKKVPQMD